MGGSLTAAFSDLKGLTELRTLVLDWNLITDAGLQDVQGFSQLSYLSIKGAHITDAGLVYLRGLSQLRRLHLEQTLTTDPEVEEAPPSLPDCTVYCWVRIYG